MSEWPSAWDPKSVGGLLEALDGIKRGIVTIGTNQEAVIAILRHINNSLLDIRDRLPDPTETPPQTSLITPDADPSPNQAEQNGATGPVQDERRELFSLIAKKELGEVAFKKLRKILVSKGASKVTPKSADLLDADELAAVMKLHRLEREV